MSTRCNIIIQDKHHHAVQLYRHSDGYPESRYGVIADLPEVLDYAWELPRMEVDDFAAAIVRAWKDGPGNIYINGTANLPDSLHGDIEYYYIIKPDEKTWKVTVFSANGNKIWEGLIGEKFPDELLEDS